MWYRWTSPCHDLFHIRLFQGRRRSCIPPSSRRRGRRRRSAPHHVVYSFYVFSFWGSFHSSSLVSDQSVGLCVNSFLFQLCFPLFAYDKLNLVKTNKTNSNFPSQVHDRTRQGVSKTDTPIYTINRMERTRNLDNRNRPTNYQELTVLPAPTNKFRGDSLLHVVSVISALQS